MVDGGGQAVRSSTGAQVDGGLFSAGRAEGIMASESMLMIGIFQNTQRSYTCQHLYPSFNQRVEIKVYPPRVPMILILI